MNYDGFLDLEIVINFKVLCVFFLTKISSISFTELTVSTFSTSKILGWWV